MQSSSNSQSWGIVGGGMLGMTLALRLAQQGQSVTLFEAAGEVGGLASAWRLGDIVWDRHYHVTLLSDTYLRKLLAELGLENEVQWVETKTGFYTDGQLYSMSNSLEFLRFPPLNVWNKCRLGATILHASRVRDWKSLEEMHVEDWLRRWSGRRTTEKIWLPLLRAKLGENYRKASAAFLWAIITRMYAARRSGMKKEMFGYVPGGYARVLETFARKLEAAGVAIRYRHRAARVESSGESVDIKFENGATHTFDQAILTMPAPIAAALCSQFSKEEKQKLKSVEYQGIVCASLLLRKPLAGYYVTNITDDWVPFTAVIEMSALVDRKHFDGNTLIYLPKYLPSDDPFFQKTDEEIKELFLNSLFRMYPNLTLPDVLSFRVSRVRHVFAIPTLNYSRKLPSIFTSVPGVQIVNSAHIVNGTLNVNETVQLAERFLPDLLVTASNKHMVMHAQA